MTKTILLPQNFVFFKMSDESEHSDSEFYCPGRNWPIQNYFSCQLTPKAQKESQHSSQLNKSRNHVISMLIDWVRSDLTGKYLALGQDAQTSFRSVRTSWPRLTENSLFTLLFWAIFEYFDPCFSLSIQPIPIKTKPKHLISLVNRPLSRIPSANYFL